MSGGWWFGLLLNQLIYNNKFPTIGKVERQFQFRPFELNWIDINWSTISSLARTDEQIGEQEGAECCGGRMQFIIFAKNYIQYTTLHLCSPILHTTCELLIFYVCRNSLKLTRRRMTKKRAKVWASNGGKFFRLSQSKEHNRVHQLASNHLLYSFISSFA